ncbi:hypothetical protein [Streptomyces sp. SYSU K21746]
MFVTGSPVVGVIALVPDDIVVYCRAGLDAYRAGDRFVVHWHEDGDAVAYDPERGSRAR